MLSRTLRAALPLAAARSTLLPSACRALPEAGVSSSSSHPRALGQRSVASSAPRREATSSDSGSSVPDDTNKLEIYVGKLPEDPATREALLKIAKSYKGAPQQKKISTYVFFDFPTASLAAEALEHMRANAAATERAGGSATVVSYARNKPRRVVDKKETPSTHTHDYRPTKRIRIRNLKPGALRLQVLAACNDSDVTGIRNKRRHKHSSETYITFRSVAQAMKARLAIDVCSAGLGEEIDIKFVADTKSVQAAEQPESELQQGVAQRPPSDVLHISRLPSTTTDTDLMAMFSAHGPRSATVQPARAQAPTTWGLVCFPSVAHATAAIDTLVSDTLLARFALPPKDTAGGGGL